MDINALPITRILEAPSPSVSLTAELSGGRKPRTVALTVA